MKAVLMFLIMSFSLSALARPEHVITIKDRLRYELWYEGLPAKKTAMHTKKVRLPEELARPLRNL